MPSLHCAVAPLGLLFSPPALDLAEGAEEEVTAGFGAGATVVFVGVEELLVRQMARALLYHFEQSVVVAVVLVVVFTAPADVPEEVCEAAVLHAALFAFPFLVQSYCRVVVFVVTAVVVVRAGVAFAAGAAAPPLHAALFALPGLEQS